MCFYKGLCVFRFAFTFNFLFYNFPKMYLKLNSFPTSIYYYYATICQSEATFLIIFTKCIMVHRILHSVYQKRKKSLCYILAPFIIFLSTLDKKITWLLFCKFRPFWFLCCWMFDNHISLFVHKQPFSTVSEIAPIHLNRALYSSGVQNHIVDVIEWTHSIQ